MTYTRQAQVSKHGSRVRNIIDKSWNDIAESICSEWRSQSTIDSFADFIDFVKDNLEMEVLASLHITLHAVICLKCDGDIVCITNTFAELYEKAIKNRE